ncbi:MAG: helix-turn-helix domain-containing protein [Planctomycetota bacterium]|jgi:excisionase family DNA binding protein|nr:helix-turn-helix domain-containing protein [Planctomycetota bacterium]MDG2143096.1 helix-turn-helix domain-containing protein [Planctomycetota bacterium]
MATPKTELDTSKAILNVDEAAALLGVSVKTFNKVLHQERVPARKVGREWKFSRQALIDWVGSGDSSSFYKPDRSNGSSATNLDGGSWKMKNS